MNLIEQFVETVKNKFSSLINEISEKIIAWQIRREIVREKRRYIGRLLDSEIHYELEEPDKELALQVVSYLEKMFPNGIKARLQELPVEKRKELMCQIVKDTEMIFDVDPVNFEILYPQTREEFIMYGCGFYNKPENLLCLNGAYLIDDNLALVEEQIYTIFHELKHARQYAAIGKEKDYGYSEEIIESWKYNSIIYIRPEECDEAYRKQAMEIDAFGFENYVRNSFSNKTRTI